MWSLILLSMIVFTSVGLPVPLHSYVHCTDVLVQIDKDHSETENLDQDNCTHVGGQILIDCKDLLPSTYTQLFYRLSHVTKFVGRLHIRNCLELVELQELMPSLRELQLQYNNNPDLESLVLENTSLHTLPHNPEDKFYGRVVIKDNLNLSLPLDQYRRYCCMEKWDSDCEAHLESGREKAEACSPTFNATVAEPFISSAESPESDVENSDSGPAWLWNRLESNGSQIAWLNASGAENATNVTGWLWNPGEANSSSSAWLWNKQEPDSSHILTPVFFTISSVLLINML